MSTPTTEVYSPGLEGVIAGETAISSITDGLSFRGYPVRELAAQCGFEEVAHLLLHGELPSRSELAEFQKCIAAARQIPQPLRALLQSVPASANFMDVLRSGVSVLAHFDPDAQDSSRAANLRKAERLLGQIPIVIAERYRILKNLPPPAPRADLGHAANFLFMLRGQEAARLEVKAFDVSQILYAEHEFNASTFTARVVCSSESDLHSSVVAAIGSLKGRLHGGANEQVMELLLKTGGPATAEKWIRAALARKEKIMGFGHRVYKAGDVRAGILTPYARQLAESVGQTSWEEVAAIIEKVLAEEKHLFPNLDWPAGRLYHALGLETPLYTPFFVAARVTGWAAHVIEQTEHNRLIRPRSRYIGPGQRRVLPEKLI